MTKLSSSADIRTRTSVICVHNHCLLTFHAIDPVSAKEYLFLPGGMIEEGETPHRCAERETQEETGYKVTIVHGEAATYAEYDFEWNGRVQRCHTYFLKAELTSDFFTPIPVHDASYNKGVVWLPVAEISERMNYHPVIYEHIIALLDPERRV